MLCYLCFCFKGVTFIKCERSVQKSAMKDTMCSRIISSLSKCSNTICSAICERSVPRNRVRDDMLGAIKVLHKEESESCSPAYLYALKSSILLLYLPKKELDTSVWSAVALCRRQKRKGRHPCPWRQYLPIKTLKTDGYKLCSSLPAPCLGLKHEYSLSYSQLLEHIRVFCSCLVLKSISGPSLSKMPEKQCMSGGAIIVSITTLKISNHRAFLSLSLSLPSTPDWKHIYRQYIYQDSLTIHMVRSCLISKSTSEPSLPKVQS
jgi:hypothetical protein